MDNIFSSIANGSLSAGSYFLSLAAAFVCGIVAAAAAGFRSHTTKSFLAALILLPPIVQTVITMVNGNIGTGVAVMGAFSLVRFRSAPGKAKDIVSIFLAMTAGLACAAGYIGIALVFTVIVSLATGLLSIVKLKTDKIRDLRITIPEALEFSGEFEDVFSEYTKSHRLISVKTSNMGSLYKLLYKVEMRDSEKLKEFIDKLRCRNGNLEISISEPAEGSDEL